MAKKEKEAEAPEAVEAEPAKPAVTMIHVRFASNGDVLEIGERPTSVTAQEWFDRLCDKTGNQYQALSGGRGIFRLPPEEVEELKSMISN